MYWEVVTNDSQGYVERLSIHNGWILRSVVFVPVVFADHLTYDYGQIDIPSMVFVPDEHHECKLQR